MKFPTVPFINSEIRKVVSSYLTFDSILPTSTYKDTNITTVYSCARVISSVVANTPLKTENRKVQKLIDKPNPFATSYDLMSNLVGDLVLKGNAYLWINRDSQGTNLFYLPYDSVQMYVTTDFNQPYYYIVTYFGRSYTFYPEELIHVKNPLASYDSFGYSGRNPIEEARLLLDISNSQSQFLKNYNDNATNVSMVIETDKKLKPEAVETFQKSFGKKYGGARNAGKVPLLHDGLKAKQLQKISPADADFIRSKELTKTEIAELFGVPPSVLGFGEQKYSNAEESNLSFQNYTISPILRSIELEFQKKLLFDRDKIQFKPNALKYVSADEKSKALSLLRNTSIITSNEAREFYDLPALDTDVADKLADELESNQSSPDVAKLNDEANVFLSQENETYRSEIQELRTSLETEIQKLKTYQGRVKKTLQELKSEDKQ